MTLLSYHGDPAVKRKYIERFAAHRAADAVVQGVAYRNGRGCFVGCTLEKYDHSRFPTELGWPVWLGRLAEAIFEGLPREEAPQFGTDLLAAVPEGVDLEPLLHTVAIPRMERNLVLLRQMPDSDVLRQVIVVTEQVRDCHAMTLRGEVPDWESAVAAARSVRAAVRSAEAWWWSEALSAALSAERSAKWSAELAAGRSADLAAEWSSGRIDAYRAERDTLLAALREMGSEPNA